MRGCVNGDVCEQARHRPSDCRINERDEALSARRLEPCERFGDERVVWPKEPRRKKHRVVVFDGKSLPIGCWLCTCADSLIRPAEYTRQRFLALRQTEAIVHQNLPVFPSTGLNR